MPNGAQLHRFNTYIYVKSTMNIIIIGMLWLWNIDIPNTHAQTQSMQYFAILDVRKSLSVAFLAISDQYETFFLQNGHRCQFWMSEIHFRSHFWPFQIDKQLSFYLFFWQNGWRRPFWMSEIHFDRISGHFRSIRNFFFFLIFILPKWLPLANLDVRNSLWITFLAILD